MIYYKNGFYASNHPSIPSGAVQITDAQHQELLDLQTQGKIIQPDSNGFPIAVTAPVTVNIKADALAEISKADITIIRARLKHESIIGNRIPILIPFSPPIDWLTYKDQLREVIAGTRTTMPNKPPYPTNS